MREVCVFLTQQLYDDNPKFVVGLRKNRIAVRVVVTTAITNDHPQQQKTNGRRDHQKQHAARDDDHDHDHHDNNQNDQYQIALRQHYELLTEINTDHSHKGPQPRLCLVFEQSWGGIRQALKANMTVIGITAADGVDDNGDDDDNATINNETAGSTTTATTTNQKTPSLDGLRRCFQRAGAHAVATSIPALLQHFHIERYINQVQYLPYVIQLRLLAESKIGYPVSFLDNLSGRFQFVSVMSSSSSVSSNNDDSSSSSSSLRHRFLVGRDVGDADDVVVGSASSGVTDHDNIEDVVNHQTPTPPNNVC